MKNSLATVNFFLGVVGVIQVTRILNYNRTHKAELKLEEGLGQAKGTVEEVKDQVVEKVKGVVGS
jgi:hypothetical protein